MKVKVNTGWQLGLPDSPKLYYEGDTFDAPDALAEGWISAGQAVAVKAVTSSPNKAVTSSPNKAVTSSPNKAAPTVKPASSFTGLPTVKK